MNALRLVALVAAAGPLVAGCRRIQPVSQETAEKPYASLFPHSKHAPFDCTDCHAGVLTATRLDEAKLPGIRKCGECHDTRAADEPARAALALSRGREPREREIRFDHAAHLKRVGRKDACATCHSEGELPEAGLERSSAPAMKACTACHHHAQEVAQAKCSPCHVSLRRHPLKPIESLVALSHDKDFVKGHGRLATTSADSCAVCHDQTYCASCHATSTAPLRPEIRFPERVESDFIHRGDFVSRHQIEAAADPAACRKCHGSFFCDSCHTAQNVSYRNRLAGGSPRDPHPPGWANDAGAGQGFHGTAARRNIVSCAGCHDQGAASVCTTCHRSFGPGSAGIGGNPHPAGFRAKHGRDDIRKNAMCSACHSNG
jgi:hypothetical protein